MKISVATVAVWFAFASGEPPAPPPPAPQKCCEKCEGTGMVWTGDKVARVPCSCPPTCPCAKNRPKMTAPICTSGSCNAR